MKILAMTDGSERSLMALPHAALLASALDADLLLSRVLDPSVDCENEPNGPLADIERRVIERWSTELSENLAAAGAHGQYLVGIRGKGERIHDSILRLAADIGADIIVMTSRGAGLVRRVALGSVALGVLARTTIPILIAGERIEPPSRAGRYRLVITSDGSPDARRAVEVAARLGQRANLDLGLLRIVTPTIGDRGEAAEEDAAWRELEALSHRFWPSRSVDIRVCTMTQLGGVDTAIIDEVSAMGADAVAMSTHGYSAQHHLLAGSTALGVIGRSRVPVLLVRSGPPIQSAE